MLFDLPRLRLVAQVIAKHADAKDTWRILATSVDLDNKRFVTAAEAKHLEGVFATQVSNVLSNSSAT
jgi:hypothetical protein